MNVIKRTVKTTTVTTLWRKAWPVLMLVVALVGLPQSVWAVDLNKVLYTKLPGNKVQINLEANGALEKPGIFSTKEPARIVFDFFGVSKAFEENDFKVGIGAVDSIVTVATDDRTRVIVNLVTDTGFTTDMLDKGFAIVVDEKRQSTAKITNVQPKPFAKQPELPSNKRVESIDFRRSEQGGGKIVVDLSDPSTSVDVYEQEGEIIIDFQSSRLADGLEKRLDVADFATPVNLVDVFQNGENVRLIIVPNGRYQQISYQSDGVYTIIVDPYVETAEDKEAREADENGYVGERLSINFQRIDVRSALAVISDFTGINIVTSDDVQGELTLNLQDVPWDQALEVILETKGLAKREKGNVIWISPAETLAALEKARLEAEENSKALEPLVSEVIQINYAKAEELMSVVFGVKVNKNDATESKSQEGVGSFGEGVVRTIAATKTGSKSGADQSPLLSNGGTVSADPRTNSLLVKLTAKNLKEAKELIAKLDRPVRQVMIETRIVEAVDSFSKELGARLGFQQVVENVQFPGTDSNFATNSIASGTLEGVNTIDNSLFVGEGLNYFSNGPGLNVDFGANAIGDQTAASYALQLFKAGKGLANIISLELSALEQDGRGKIVASPRLVTANQREASIKQGEERLLVVAERVNQQGNFVVETEIREAVLGLVVTPQITPDDRVILDVAITQDFFAGPQTINKKEIITQVLIDNGETIVIGGIYQESDSNTVTKVPLLGDLPVVGRLFKKRSSSKNKIELLIFLTPKIVNEQLKLG